EGNSGTRVSERMLVLEKTVNSPTDIVLWVQRTAYCDLVSSGLGPLSFNQHANGWTATAVQNNGCYGGAWWADASGALKGWLLEDPSITASHSDIGPALTPGAYTVVS